MNLNNTEALWIIQIMIKLIWSIFMSSNNLFRFFFFGYIEISKNSSSKYDQNNKGRLQKHARGKY